jgi:3'(2'), 5'-bisphosphate nucleotidase
MARRVAIDAGALLYEHFEAYVPGMEDHKADGSPVTAADRAAEALIAAALSEIVPGIPVVAEEAVAAGNIPDLSGAEYFWLVDPLDGTKSFVNSEPDFTVNIALIKNGEPIIGVIYAPVKGELYSGCGPGTALRALEETGSEKEIIIRPCPASGLVVMASQSHGDAARLDEFLSLYKVAKVTRISSSLKFCAVASGKADMYARFGPTSEWDTAAGDAIMRAAGAGVFDMTGKPLRYGKVDAGFINPEFVACDPALLVPMADDA